MDFKEDDLEDFVDGWAQGELLEKRAKALEEQERREKRAKKAESREPSDGVMAQAFKSMKRKR